jgi:hypothetical protein
MSRAAPNPPPQAGAGTTMALGGPERTPQSDLTSSFEDRYHHDVAYANGPDEQGHGTEAQEEVVEGALGVGLDDGGQPRAG